MNTTIFIKENEKLTVKSGSKGITNSMNNTCNVFDEEHAIVNGIKFNLHLLINGNLNRVYDINDASENWLQAKIGNYVIIAPVVVKDNNVVIIGNKFSIHDSTEDRSLMDNYDFKYTFSDIEKLKA